MRLSVLLKIDSNMQKDRPVTALYGSHGVGYYKEAGCRSSSSLLRILIRVKIIARYNTGYNNTAASGVSS